MKTPGAVLLLLWSALVVAAADSGDSISENDIFSQSLDEAEIRDNEVLGGTVMTMEARLRANEKTVMTMEARLRANEKTVMTMEASLRANEKLVQRLMNDIEASASAVSQVEELGRKREETKVAFSASLITSGHLTLGPFSEPTTLIYKNVITNIGNAYSNNTGIFTAPVRGVYHFAIFVYGFGHDYTPTGASLRKNGEHVVIAYSHLPSGRASASNGASLLLEVGDQVCVVLWETNAWVRDSYNHHTSFSGHLLFPM